MRIGIQGKNGHKVVNLNRRKAIRERCLNCAGWYPKEITNCNFVDCPLYSYRSGKEKQNVKARTRAIREYCQWCSNESRTEAGKCVVRDCPLFSYRLSIVDRSREIVSLPEKHHIEPISESKTGQDIGCYA